MSDMCTILYPLNDEGMFFDFISMLFVCVWLRSMSAPYSSTNGGRSSIHNPALKLFQNSFPISFLMVANIIINSVSISVIASSSIKENVSSIFAIFILQIYYCLI